MLKEVVYANGNHQPFWSDEAAQLEIESLAGKAANQQLLLDIYLGELRRTKDAARQGRLQADLQGAGNLLWQYRFQIAQLRMRGAKPEPPRRSTYLVNSPFSLPANLIGRQDAFYILEDWRLHEPELPAIVLAGVEGAGKSALLWDWLRQLRQAKQLPPLVVWWQFDQRHQGVPQFVARLLDYFGENLAAFSSLRQAINRLLERLKGSEALIVLDGVEKLQWNWQRKPSATILQTANQWKAAETGHLLQGLLAGAGADVKVVMSCQAIPQLVQESPTALRLSLAGLSERSALQLLSDAGIPEDTPFLAHLIQQLQGNPFYLRLLSGILGKDKTAIIEAASNIYRRIEKLPIELKRSHILEQAYAQLPAVAKDFLTPLAALDEPVSLQTAHALFSPHNPGSRQLDEVKSLLRLLGERGFVGRSENKGEELFDTHPAIDAFVQKRGVGADGVGEGEAEERISSIPETSELEPVMRMYQQLAQAGRFEEALKLYKERLSDALYFQFGAYQDEIELLSMLLSNDGKRRPRLPQPKDQAWTLNSLAGSYLVAGKPIESAALFAASNQVYEQLGNRKSWAIGLSDQAQALLMLGELQNADKALRHSIELCRQLGNQFQEAISQQWRGYLLSLTGNWTGAAAALDTALSYAADVQHPQLEGIVWLQGAQSALLRGRASAAMPALEKAQDNLAKWGQIDAIAARHWARYDWLLSWAYLLENRLEEAESQLDKAAKRATKSRFVPLLQMIQLTEAKLLQAQALNASNLPLTDSPAEMRQKAWTLMGRVQREAEGDEMQLIRADVHILMSKTALENGNRELALQHAEIGYQCAWCDAPPFSYAAGVEAARGLEHAAQKEGIRRLRDLSIFG